GGFVVTDIVNANLTQNSDSPSHLGKVLSLSIEDVSFGDAFSRALFAVHNSSRAHRWSTVATGRASGHSKYQRTENNQIPNFPGLFRWILHRCSLIVLSHYTPLFS